MRDFRPEKSVRFKITWLVQSILYTHFLTAQCEFPKIEILNPSLNAKLRHLHVRQVTYKTDTKDSALSQ